MMITVGVTSYNKSQTIIRCLESIVTQSVRPSKIIIHDDASTDGSVDLIGGWIANYKGSIDIEFLISEDNVGVCKSANRIIGLVETEFFTIIGSDDYYLSTFLENRLKVLREHPEYDLVYSSVLLETKGVLSRENRVYYPVGSIRDFMLRNYVSFCNPSSILYRYDSFIEVGFFNEKLLFEDLDWFWRASKNIRVFYIEPFDVVYHVSNNGLGHRLFHDFRHVRQYIILVIVNWELQYSLILSKKVLFAIKSFILNMIKRHTIV